MRLLAPPSVSRLIFGTALLLLATAGAVRAQTFSWTRQYVGVALTLNSIAYSPERGERLAIGTSGALVTSRDAVTWTRGNAGTTTTLNGVAWGSGQYVAVGAGGLIRTSPDGVTWTTRTSETTNNLAAVAWISPSTTGAGQWIAVGANGTIRTSPDGVTWTARTSGVENMNPAIGLRGITWANPQNTATGIALAVGDRGATLTSSDGITWTVRNPGGAISWGGVVWTGTQAVAVGNSGAIWTSTNTTNWTSRSIVNPITFSFIVWAPGTGGGRYIAGGADTEILATSTDNAVTWVDVNPFPSNKPVVKGSVWDGSRFIVLESNGKLVVSHDGVLPGTPVPKSPADSTVVLSLTPSLAWKGLSGIGTYHVQVSTSSTFSSAALNDTAVTDTSRLSSSLIENTGYYWRVRARNVAGYGPWSTPRAFRTQQNPPPQAFPSLPAQNATGVPAFGQFTFGGLGTATGYTLQVALDSGFSAPILNDSAITGTSRPYGPLSYATTYYWRVRGYNGAGNGPWSAIRSFTTEAAPTGVPPAPVLAAPVPFSNGVSLSPTFGWNAASGALSYQIQGSTVATFASKAFEDSLLTKTGFSGVALTGSTTYYWRVRARNGFGYGPWSEVSAFSTLVSKPDAPALISPANFTTEVAYPLSLTWGAVTGSTTYHVQLSLAPDFGTFLFLDSGLTGASALTGYLLPSTPYYWRVRAKNSAGVSEWSTIRRFTTGAGVALAPGLEPSRRFQVSADRVAFHLARRERVRISLFDARGENKMELTNGLLDAGRQEIRIPSSASGGLRFLVFRTGHDRETVLLAP
jgi:hypothetical protein